MSAVDPFAHVDYDQRDVQHEEPPLPPTHRRAPRLTRGQVRAVVAEIASRHGAQVDEQADRFVVTVEDLHALEACHPAIAKFEATFGAHVDVTLENVGRAFQADINVDWWARKVLGSEYEQKRAQAWAEYQRGRAQALAEHAWAEYQRVMAREIVALSDAYAAQARQRARSSSQLADDSGGAEA